jgi:hypothetical protein
MKSKDKQFMTFAEWERFNKKLNKSVSDCLISIKDLGEAFGRAAKILKNDKFYNAICAANKYIERKKNRERYFC